MIDLEGVQAVQLAMIAHCELMGDRVAILDAPPGLNAQQIKEWRVDKAGYDSKYATLYWPWVKVFDPLDRPAATSSRRAATWPASGRRNDDTRGVHKAPANEVVRGAISLELNITKAEHDLLNPVGHQLHPLVPRPRHPGVGRSHALERSGVALPQRPPALQLPRGVDPRGHPVGRLRAQRPCACGRRVKRTINAFLLRVWRDGALFGATPDEAFYVKCDAETNPPEVVDAGQLVCEIGIAPVKPAEFVVFRISQFSGGTAAESASDPATTYRGRGSTDGTYRSAQCCWPRRSTSSSTASDRAASPRSSGCLERGSRSIDKANTTDGQVTHQPSCRAR